MPYAHEPVNTALNLRGVDYGNSRITAEILSVEGQNRQYEMRLHKGRQMRIVSLSTRNTVRIHNAPPNQKHFRRVRKKQKEPVNIFQFLIC